MKPALFAASAWAAAKVRIGKRLPLRVTHCLTWKCNLNCSYCTRHNGETAALSAADAISLMRSFRRAGTRYWSFNGGEPLLHPAIGELISVAKSLGMHVSLNTNGTLIRQHLEALLLADLVSISLDGPREIHDQARGTSYDLILAGAEDLRRRGARLAFICVIGKHNLNGLDHVLDLAHAFQTAVYFQPLRRQKEDIQGKALGGFPSPEEMRQTMDWLLEAKKKGRPVASSESYLRAIRAHWPDSLPGFRCYAGRIFAYITPEGKVTACCDTLLRALPPQPSAPTAFKRIPPHSCRTCFSCGPLETNILMSNLPARALSLFVHRSPPLL